MSGGGADANVFNSRGLPCLNLANGMAEIHTPDEHFAVTDLEGMVEVTLELVDLARAREALMMKPLSSLMRGAGVGRDRGYEDADRAAQRSAPQCFVALEVGCAAHA